MQNKTIEIPLHDIKPLVAIPDYSFYYFMALVIIGSLITVGLFFLLVKWLRRRKKFDVRKEHAKALQNIKLTDAKKAAYALSRYGATFANDSQRHQKIYQELLDELSRYKYKKEIDEEFDANTLRLIELYRGMIDV
jgi:hypothetical protein